MDSPNHIDPVSYSEEIAGKLKAYVANGVAHITSFEARPSCWTIQVTFTSEAIPVPNPLDALDDELPFY